MALPNFISPPTVGQQQTINGTTYEWDGTKWFVIQATRAVDHNATTNRNAVGAHDDIYNRRVTVSDLAIGIYSVGYTVNVIDRYNSQYTVVAGGSPDGKRVLDAGNGNTAIPTDVTTISADEYATFGANVVSGSTSLTHSSGSIETINAAINVQPDTYYKVTVDITTTNAGYVKILFGNDTVPANQVEAIYGDQSNGFWFDTVAILADGTENNRLLTTNLYTFSLYTSASGFTNLQISTDVNWGGTISGITIEPVIEKPAYNKILPSDGVDRGYYTGIKAGSVNRNDIALGDKSALGMFVYDGLSPTPAHNLAIGSKTLSAMEHGDECTAVGTFALQGNEGSNNTAFGYSALKVNNKGQENTSIGYKSGVTNTTGYRNTYGGFWAGARNKTGRGNVVFGWQNNTAGVDKSFTTALGYNAGSGFSGSQCVFVGASAGTSTSGQEVITGDFVTGIGSEAKPVGIGATTVGFQSKTGSEGAPADNAVAVGRGANAVSARSVSVGYLANSQSVGAVAIGDTAIAGPDGAVAVGDGAISNGSRAISVGNGATAAGTQSVVMGSLATPSGINTTAVGFRALNNYTGQNNTAVGHTAGNQVATAYNNCTLLGYITEVTGSNQVQLGNSLTTTYAYGAVQDRSDKRDKLDIKDLTDAHIAFFMDVEWKQYRMNHRERYKDMVDGEVVEVENDGSRAGSRFHIGAVAQQVEEAMKRHGIDFAGLQHHSVNGGDDVYTIGYQEFIGIQGLIIQRQQKAIESILTRLDLAGL